MTEYQDETILVPPQNKDSEQACLGAMLLQREAITNAEEVGLTPADFYWPGHQIIYSAILDLYHQRQPVEIYLLTDYLAARAEGGRPGTPDDNLLLRVNGQLYLSDITTMSAGSAGIKPHGARVKECSRRRELIRQAAQISASAYRMDIDLDTIIQDAERKIFAVSDNSRGDEHRQSIGEFANRAYAAACAAAEDQRPQGLRTGWASINEKLRPFLPGHLIVIAADTGMCKTTWAINLSIDLARKYEKHGLVFSLEMVGEELSLRGMLEKMIYKQRDIDMIGYVPKNELLLDDMKKAMDRLWPLTLTLDDYTGSSLSRMEHSIRREVQQNGKLDFIVVDYLQFVPSEEHGGRKRYEEVGYISRGLKSLAKQYKCVVFALCQVGTKENERKAVKRPQLSDLYESGRIAQDADLVAALYWPGKYGPDELERAGYDPQKHGDLVEFNVLKSRSGTRDGATAATLLRYEGERFRFHDIDSLRWIGIKEYLHLPDKEEEAKEKYPDY